MACQGPPVEIDELDVEADDIVAGSPDNYWHTDECHCNRRRHRTIVERHGNYELWACVECGALYWMPDIDAQNFEETRDGYR